jgi:hypothetical protein
MSQLVLFRGVNYRRSLIQKFYSKISLGPYFLIGSLIVFVALITVITLIFSARQVTKGYVFDSLENHHQDVVKQNEQIDMQISNVRSMLYIQNSNKVNSMRRPSQIVFVNGATPIASVPIN